MAEIAPKPVPEPTHCARPFWAACHEGKLRLQRCGGCGRFVAPARLACPACGAVNLTWQEASGRGRVFSFTVVHRAPDPVFRAEVPYVVAIIELDEGVRLLSNVVGCAPAALRVGMPVRAVFDAVAADIGVPKFQPELEGERV